jgi:hypothetical protein
MADEANARVSLAVWRFFKGVSSLGETISFRFQSDEFGITF